MLIFQFFFEVFKQQKLWEVVNKILLPFKEKYENVIGPARLMNEDGTRPLVGKISRYPPIAAILVWKEDNFEDDPKKFEVGFRTIKYYSYFFNASIIFTRRRIIIKLCNICKIL